MRWRVVALAVLACACAFGSSSKGLKSYRLLVESHDSLANALAVALKQKGFNVKRRISGGSPPTAAVITRTFRDSNMTWLAAWFADTRNGAIVAGVSVPVDTLPTAAGQAQAVAVSVAALIQQPAPPP